MQGLLTQVARGRRVKPEQSVSFERRARSLQSLLEPGPTGRRDAGPEQVHQELPQVAVRHQSIMTKTAAKFQYFCKVLQIRNGPSHQSCDREGAVNLTISGRHRSLTVAALMTGPASVVSFFDTLR